MFDATIPIQVDIVDDDEVKASASIEETLSRDHSVSADTY